MWRSGNILEAGRGVELALILLTLHIEEIEAPQDYTDGGCGSDDDEYNCAEPPKSEKGGKVVCVESPESTNGEPLETDPEASPETLCVGEKVFLAGSAGSVNDRVGRGAMHVLLLFLLLQLLR